MGKVNLFSYKSKGDISDLIIQCRRYILYGAQEYEVKSGEIIFFREETELERLIKDRESISINLQEVEGRIASLKAEDIALQKSVAEDIISETSAIVNQLNK